MIIIFVINTEEYIIESFDKRKQKKDQITARSPDPVNINFMNFQIILIFDGITIIFLF